MLVPQTALGAYHDASAGIGLAKTSSPGLARQRCPSQRQPGVLILLQQGICSLSKEPSCSFSPFFRRRSMVDGSGDVRAPEAVLALQHFPWLHRGF